MSSRFENLVSQHTRLTIIHVNDDKNPIHHYYTYSLTQFRKTKLTRIKSRALFENKHTRALYLKSVNIKYTRNSKECVVMHIKPCIYKIKCQIKKKQQKTGVIKKN